MAASMVRARRAFLILLPVMLAVLAGWWWLSRPEYVVFAQGLRPADAAAVVAELDKRAAPYRLAGGGGTILIPADRADALRVALAGNEVAARGLVGFEMFNESDMGLTNFAQKINYQRALQGELTRTILMMDGVADARVHLALPEKSLFRGEQAEASAAVAIEMKPGAALDPSRVAGIRRLVAAAAIDLPEARVVVLDGAGRQIGGPAPDMGGKAIFDTGAPPPTALPAPVFAPVPDASVATAHGGSAWPWVVALAAIAGLALIGVRRRRQRRPMLDAAGRDAFALRLRQAMETADGRG